MWLYVHPSSGDNRLYVETYVFKMGRCGRLMKPYWSKITSLLVNHTLRNGVNVVLDMPKNFLPDFRILK